MPERIPKLEQKLQLSFYVFYTLYLALLVLLSYWNLSRAEGVLWTVWALQCAPLLAFLPGLIKGWYRSYSWFCFLLLLYFIAATEASFKSTAGLGEYLFLTFTVLLFICSMMRSRWLQFALYRSDEKETSIEQV